MLIKDEAGEEKIAIRLSTAILGGIQPGESEARKGLKTNGLFNQRGKSPRALKTIFR